IPKQRQQQAKLAGKVLGNNMWQRFPWAADTKPMSKQLAEIVLNRTWRPFLEVIGADGLPSVATAGNVLRPSTTFKLSLRLPPTANPEACSEHLVKLLSKSPLHGAKVTVTSDEPGGGWNAPELSPWLEQACA